MNVLTQIFGRFRTVGMQKYAAVWADPTVRKSKEKKRKERRRVQKYNRRINRGHQNTKR